MLCRDFPPISDRGIEPLGRVICGFLQTRFDKVQVQVEIFLFLELKGYFNIKACHALVTKD